MWPFTEKKKKKKKKKNIFQQRQEELDDIYKFQQGTLYKKKKK